MSAMARTSCRCHRRCHAVGGRSSALPRLRRTTPRKRAGARPPARVRAQHDRRGHARGRRAAIELHAHQELGLVHASPRRRAGAVLDRARRGGRPRCDRSTSTSASGRRSTPVLCRNTQPSRRRDARHRRHRRGTSYYDPRRRPRRTPPTTASRCASSCPTRPRRSPAAGSRARASRGVVDRLANADDAWAVARAARPRRYRLNFVSSGGRCAIAELFDSADSFGERSGAAAALRCPHGVRCRRQNATYSVLVRAPRASRERLTLPRCAWAAHRRDDTAPGARGWPTTCASAAGCAAAELDALDLYRFTDRQPEQLLRLAPRHGQRLRSAAAHRFRAPDRLRAAGSRGAS